MSVEQRIRLCILIEKMYEQKKFCEKLGLEDRSHFRGEKIRGGEEEKHVDLIV